MDNEQKPRINEEEAGDSVEKKAAPKKNGWNVFFILAILFTPVMLIGSWFGANSAGAEFNISLYQVSIWLIASAFLAAIGGVVYAVRKKRQKVKRDRH